MFIEGKVNINDTTIKGTLEELLLRYEILNALPVPVFFMTLDHRYRVCNKAFSDFVGQPVSSILGKTVAETMPLPEQDVLYTTRDDEFLNSGKEVSSEEREMLYSDGTFHTVQMTKAFMRNPDGKASGFVCAFMDLSEQKKAQAKRKNYQDRLKLLASALIKSKEQQQIQLATQIHDSVGQTLALLKLRVQMLNTTLPMNELNNTHIKEILDIIDTLILTTRTITFDLGIPVLYQLGLGSSIEWLCADMKNKYGLETRCIISNIPGSVRDDLKILIFRSIQELLINIVKHSKVLRAVLKISCNETSIDIKVADNGVGIGKYIKQSKSYDKKSFGLFSTQTLINSVGGSMSIKSQHGTHIHIVIPLEGNA